MAFPGRRFKSLVVTQLSGRSLPASALKFTRGNREPDYISDRTGVRGLLYSSCWLHGALEDALMPLTAQASGPTPPS